MKYYKHSNGWEALNDEYSRFWEIHKKYSKLKKIHILQPRFCSFPFEKDKEGKYLNRKRLSDKEFVEYLKEIKRHCDFISRQCEEAIEKVVQG
jgi:hypothetical protein